MLDKRLSQIANNATYGFWPTGGVDDIVYMLRKLGVPITPMGELQRCNDCNCTGNVIKPDGLAECPTCKGHGHYRKEEL